LVVVIITIDKEKRKKRETVILVDVKSVSSLRPKTSGYILRMPIDPLMLPSLPRNHSVTSSDAPTF